MKIIRQLIVLLCCLSFLLAAYSLTIPPKEDIVITVQGVEAGTLKNVESRLKVKKSMLSKEASNLDKWHFYKNIPQEVTEAIQPYGFFKAKIKTQLKQIDKQWLITVNINPGPRLKFTNVAITLNGAGTKDPDFKKYFKHLPITTGINFNTKKYEKIKDKLQAIANNNGYFKAKFIENSITINLNTYTSSVIITFDTGPRYRFGETTFSPSPIKKSLLQRYLTYSQAEYYNNNSLEQSRLNLTTANYFQQVSMTPEIEQATNFMIPIKTVLKHQDQIIYNFGAGYGTDTGIRGLFGMDIRWINKYGHSLKTLLRGSQKNSELGFHYNIPGPKPVQDFFSINAGLANINQETGTSNSAQIGASYQTILYNWRLTTSLTYLIEKYQLINYPSFGQNVNTNASMLYPSVTLQRTDAKPNLLTPSRGYNIIAYAAGASKNVFSKSSFAQGRLDTKFLYTIFGGTRLVLRASAGATAINNLVNVPLSMQFYTGGATSLRGYIYNSIGPGRYLGVGSFEIQQRIKGNFYIAGFVDAGNVSNNLFKSKARMGAGPAAVYLSPIGAIELSIATPINPVGGHWYVQFSMGTLI